MNLFTVKTGSGRNLDSLEAGDPDGLPVFFLHGTPGSRTISEEHMSQAEKHGIRLISYSRPGYGGSTSVSGRRVIDTATDVREIADSLGIERFGVAGHSGGGPDTLACAYSMPERVVGASSIAGVAPFNAEGLDFFAGMGEYNVSDFKLLLTDPEKWEKNNRADMDMIINATEDEVREMLSTLLSDVDREALSGDFIQMMTAQAREACSDSLDGLRDDNLSYLNPWSFDPAEIRIPVQIWHGSEDRFVPFQHGKWLAERVPGSDNHLISGEGHISIFYRSLHNIFQWISEKF